MKKSINQVSAMLLFLLGQTLLLFSYMSRLPGVKMVSQPCSAELHSGYNFGYFFIGM